MNKTNLISKAVNIVGLQPLAAVCGVSYQAVRKWQKKGSLPRTEWTGETDYGSLIESATDGKVRKEALMEDGIVNRLYQ